MEIIDLLTPDSPRYELPFRTLTGSNSPVESHIGKMFLDLLNTLRSQPDKQILLASSLLDEELRLSYAASDRQTHVSISIRVDSMDFGLVENGLPRFHFRICRTFTSPLNQFQPYAIENRVTSVEDASDLVLDTIRKTRSPI